MFAVCAGLAVAAAALVAPLRVPPVRAAGEEQPGVLAGLGECVALAAGRQDLRLMLALLTAGVGYRWRA